MKEQWILDSFLSPQKTCLLEKQKVRRMDDVGACRCQLDTACEVLGEKGEDAGLDLSGGSVTLLADVTT